MDKMYSIYSMSDGEHSIKTNKVSKGEKELSQGPGAAILNRVVREGSPEEL